MKYVVEFDHRSDNGPELVGPFDSREDANRWVNTLAGQGWSASWLVAPMTAPTSCGGGE